MSKVYIALQDNEESHYSVEAIEEDNPDVTVIYQPAMIRIECEGHMVIKRETVEEKMGRDWEIPALDRVSRAVTVFSCLVRMLASTQPGRNSG